MRTIWFNGLSGSGKTTLGKILVKHYEDKGYKTFLLDGDVLRDGLNKDLKFTIEDRKENIRRAAEVAKIFNQQDVIVFATFITPTNEIREMIKEILDDVLFLHLDTPLETCETRDVKGLYKKARAGVIPNFTGIDSPFENMSRPWLKINTSRETIDVSVTKVIMKLNQVLGIIKEF